MFYGFIYAVCLTALLCVWFPSLRAFLRWRPKSLRSFCVGEAALVLFLGSFLAGLYLYWFRDHGWQGEDQTAYTLAENGARAAGQVGNAILGLLLLPAAKNNVWAFIFGSWRLWCICCVVIDL